MSYMNIFARLTLADPSFVAQTIQLIGQQQQMSEGFLHIVLDSWINKVSQLRASLGFFFLTFYSFKA